MAITSRQQYKPQCVPLPGRSFQLLVLLQSIFSAVCVFFIALALRNLFPGAVSPRLAAGLASFFRARFIDIYYCAGQMNERNFHRQN